MGEIHVLKFYILSFLELLWVESLLQLFLSHFLRSYRVLRILDLNLFLLDNQLFHPR